MLTRHKDYVGEANADQALTFSPLYAFRRAGGQCFDADGESGELLVVPDAAVDHQAGPAVGDSECPDLLTDERTAQGATNIHDEYAAVTLSFQHGADQRVVLEYLHGCNLPRKGCRAAKIPKQRGTDLKAGAVRVIEIRGTRHKAFA